MEISMDEEDELSITKGRQTDNYLKIVTRDGAHDEVEQIVDSEKGEKLRLCKKKLKKAQKAQFSQDLYQQVHIVFFSFSSC
jgi:hypothetical protein